MKYVFSTRVEALANRPVDEKNRFRLYACSVQGQTRFVWERHGPHAAGRAAMELGMTITLVDETDLKAVRDAVASMTAEEKALLIAELTR